MKFSHGVIAAFLTLASSWAAAYPPGYFENPAPNATESGISVFSGWHCTAKSVEVLIDGVSWGNAGIGTRRPDLQEICGHESAGFSFLFNFNELSVGSHVATILIDGNHWVDRDFSIVRSGGTQFLRDAHRTEYLRDFPAGTGAVAKLEWSEPKQSFVVTGRWSSEDDVAQYPDDLLGAWNFLTTGASSNTVFNLTKVVTYSITGELLVTDNNGYVICKKVLKGKYAKKINCYNTSGYPWSLYFSIIGNEGAGVNANPLSSDIMGDAYNPPAAFGVRTRP